MGNPFDQGEYDGLNSILIPILLRNYKMEEFVRKIGIKIEFSPSYSPWSNGLNERSHMCADRIVRKLMDEGVSLEMAVSRACWTHNMNIMVNGYNPLTFMTGKSVVIPGISTGNMATESKFEDEAVRDAMENRFEITKKFREIEYGSKIDKAMKARMKGYEDMVIQKGDMVFYQTNNEKAWLGPTEVTDVDNNYVFVKINGDRRKVPKCNVKLNVKNSDGDEEIIENDDKEEKKEKVKFDEGMVTHAKKKLMDGNNEDAVATYWMTIEQKENFTFSFF